MKRGEIVVLKSAEELAVFAAELLISKISQIPEGNFYSIALSGGSTPKIVFNHLASHYSDNINWKKVRFFWGDERCVPPNDEQSNFKMAHTSLLSKLKIPEENIFRVHGESIPGEEAIRYSKIVKENVTLLNGLPIFDMIFLGLGEDGHTASIFPHEIGLFNSPNFAEAATNIVSGQRRITLTGSVINNARDVVFLVSGKGKEKIISSILHDDDKENFPASLVKPLNGNLTWLLDADAAKSLRNKV